VAGIKILLTAPSPCRLQVRTVFLFAGLIGNVYSISFVIVVVVVVDFGSEPASGITFP